MGTSNGKYVFQMSNQELLVETAKQICDHMCPFPKKNLSMRALSGICQDCTLDKYFLEIKRRLPEKPRKSEYNVSSRYIAKEFCECGHGFIAKTPYCPMCGQARDLGGKENDINRSNQET